MYGSARMERLVEDFNRTIKELKFDAHFCFAYQKNHFNRTIKELK